MKLLIKFVIVGIVFILLALYIGLNVYSKALVTNIASQALGTNVEIANVRFVPRRLALQLNKVKVPKWDMVFSRGIVHLVPLGLQLRGLEIKRKLEILEDKLSIQVNTKNLFSKPKLWEISMTFKSIDLINLSTKWPDAWSYGFSKGTLDGTINGTYSGKDCKLYGVLHFYDMVYDESSAKRPNGPLGIPIEEIAEFIQDNNGSIDLDFTYKGPLDGLNDPFRYRPGPKIIRSLSAYLIKKIF